MRPRRVIRTSAEGGNSVNTRATQPFAVFICNVRRPYPIAHCGAFLLLASTPPAQKAPGFPLQRTSYRRRWYRPAVGVWRTTSAPSPLSRELVERGRAACRGFFLLCGLVGIHALDSGLDEY